MLGFLKKLFGSAQDRKVRRYRTIVQKVNEWDEKYQSLSDEQLRNKTAEFRERFKQGETLDQLLPEAYGVVKNVCRRLVGTEVHVSGYDQKWDMVPYDVQVIGAIAMHNGTIAEMQTGEGKTLTAVMALYLNALSGKPVHLVTVNDYLAQRDCAWVGTVLRWLGLTTGALTNEVPTHLRKSIYQSDVVYGTASEFGFDYLRDNSICQSKEEQVQRGFFYAIIDETDSILIDEARTPLIISGPVPNSRQMYDELKEGVADLVRRQRDYCNRLATEARKVLDKPEGIAKDLHSEEAQEALRKLWLVGKGTPRNKVLKRLKEDPDLRAAMDKVDLYFYVDTNKDEKAELLSQLFMIVDEKGNEYELTDKGIASWHGSDGSIGKSEDFVMLDLSHEFLLIDQDPGLDDEAKLQKRLAILEEDAVRKERAHNLRQLLRGHLLMEKDVDYIIEDGKVVIIDENTGRPQPGRRFSDGLHQAIEAKEGVSIQKETQTYATITLQNYFRMYEKLAGMTGTAITEANELKEIYKLEVLQIPTHRPCVRVDENDKVYMTEREKYNAMLQDIATLHAAGRPILIGTESVEVSEKLARILRQNRYEHVVLNAKNHAMEAEIVAHAGRKNAITIATNMAGRGTDIKLEPGIADIGGLHVMASTRHQSRRIDRQLLGRCARQGDPGSTQVYVSFEDSLLRLFASPTLTSMLQRFRPPEGEPISAGIINKSIETAQKRVEQRNYTIRKHTLQYDDVMNKQRQEIYSFRNDILHNEDINQIGVDLLESVCAQEAEQFFVQRPEQWDHEGYRRWLIEHFPVSFEENHFDQELLDAQELANKAADKIVLAFEEKITREKGKIPPPPAGKEHLPNPVDNALRNLMIREVDHLWQEHLLTMDYLRSDVNLRTVGQRDPLIEFKHEAFRLFDELSRKLKVKIAQNLFRFEMVPYDPLHLQRILGVVHMETARSFTDDLAPPAQQQQGEQPPISSASTKILPFSAPLKTGRNEDCPCGSGKKYKKCCGASREEESDDLVTNGSHEEK